MRMFRALFNFFVASATLTASSKKDENFYQASNNFTFTPTVPPETPDLTKGLVAHYPFDGTLEDLTGRGHDATPIGEPAFINESDTKKGIHFHSKQDGVKIAADPALNSDSFSVSLNVRANYENCTNTYFNLDLIKFKTPGYVYFNWPISRIYTIPPDRFSRILGRGAENYVGPAIQWGVRLNNNWPTCNSKSEVEIAYSVGNFDIIHPISKDLFNDWLHIALTFDAATLIFSLVLNGIIVSQRKAAEN